MKKTILILVANPQGSGSLNLLPEVRNLQEAIQRSLNRERFTVEWRVDVQQEDLRRHILEIKPQIIHYCGHGTKEGLVIHDENNQVKLLSNEFLADLLKNFSDRVECLVLNSCDTEPLAIEVAKHINYAIGMNQEVNDKSAIAFSEAFYDAIGSGEGIEKAFEIGKNAILGITSSGNQGRKVTVVGEDDSPVKIQNQEYLIPTLKKNDHPVIFPSLTPSEEVGKGLSALKDLMTNPKIYAEVKAGKDKLQEACNQIKIISTYKSVHDELHSLEFECYQPIIDQEQYPSDDINRSLRDLRGYHRNLQRINRNLHVITQEKIENQPILQETEWLKDLNQVQSELSEFIEISNEIADFCKLQPTIYLLNRVLAIQPTVMDANLHYAAKDLSLPILVQSMCVIRDDIDQVEPISEQESKKIRYFQEGVKALEDLLQVYDSLIMRHNDWQRIELELRLIQSNLNQNINTLQRDLARLKTKMEKQYSDSGEEWMEEMKILKKFEDKLNNSLTTKAEISKVKDDFQAWRGQASYCFFILDKELNSFCGQLKDYIYKPLQSIIEMMAS